MFDQQDSAMQDRLASPEVSPEEAVHPGFWGGLTLGTPLQGAASGTLTAGSSLLSGLPGLAHNLVQQVARGHINPADIAINAGLQSGLDRAGEKSEPMPWEKSLSDTTAAAAAAARAGAKAVTPDPRLTGSAANLVFGASKVLTEAGLSTAAAGGNPILGAIATGEIEGTARYKDLKDQGVDDATAFKAAAAEGGFQAAGLLIPGGLPTKWLADMAKSTRLMTQLATAAASNVGQGVANRYISHKILEDAGFPELAEQAKVFDGEAMLTDALAGGIFGGAHFKHGEKELAARAAWLGEHNSTVRDAARVAQNSQQITERAPGVPVDMPSQAVNRASLAKATEDLLADRPVDVSEQADHGTFAKPAEDTTPIRQMMLEEFQKAGVFDESARLDEFNDSLESLYTRGPVKPQERETFQMPDEHGEVGDANERLKAATDEAAQVGDEAPKMFKAAAACASAVA